MDNNKIEYLKDRISLLKEKLLIVKEKLESKYQIISKANDDENKVPLFNGIDVLIKQKINLEKQIEKLYDAIRVEEMTNWKLIGYNDLIDVYKISPGLDGRYFIYLHNTSLEVGMIEYYPKNEKDIYGDISYTIDLEYQGNNYAYYALSILSTYLFDNNILDLRISTMPNNLSSQKTIEKFIKDNCLCNKKVVDGISIYDIGIKRKNYHKL